GNLDYFFFQAEDGIRDSSVTGVQTCALPISGARVRDALYEEQLINAVAQHAEREQRHALAARRPGKSQGHDDGDERDGRHRHARSEERRVGEEGGEPACGSSEYTAASSLKRI